MTATSSMTGKILNGRYEIGESIGVGGMAEVYSAQDNVLGRIVAVKVMLPQYANDDDFARRFRQEAAAAANLQSPYIVNVYDWGHDAGTYFIVMEYVRGSDLKSAIKQRGAINQRKVAEIGSQVCQALTVAHSQDIIHRDIKPQNIMIQPDGNVKVMDFGIARAKNSLSEKTGNVLGTAHYISPEQAQGKDVTAATDIYSLGVVMYEAATGKLPFDAPDAMSVALMQVQDQPMKPSAINPDLDPALESIILKAMSKNASGRYSTAHDMKIALNDYLAGRMNPSFTQARTSVIPPAMGVVPVGGVGDHTEVMPAINNSAASTSEQAPRNYSKNNTSSGMSKGKKVGIAAAVVGAIVVVGLVLAALLGGGGDKIDVPDVTGKTTEEAKQIIEDAGFQVGSMDSAYDTNTEAGHISSQSPKGGEKASKGSKINLVVSQGTEEVEVPDLKNKTLEEAQKEILKAGFALGSTTEDNSDDVDKGKVMKQSPDAGKSVKKGSTITLVISKGAEEVEVPNIVGMSESNAQKTLESVGLKYQNNGTQASDKDAGYVISQTQSAGTKVKKGSTVGCIVSSGPKVEYGTVPYGLEGNTKESAVASLKNAGFEPNVNDLNPSSSGQKIVKSVSPSEGTKLEKGSTVTITVDSE